MTLNLDISKYKHKLIKPNQEHSLFDIKEDKEVILNTLEKLLIEQETIDPLQYEKNISEIPEFKDTLLKKRNAEILYKKLNISEKSFIIKYNYDYRKDPLNLLNQDPSPKSPLVDEWIKIQEEKLSSNLHDFYGNRVWS
ncbi:MAG: hypothetical protein C0625_02175 [Arcobacter sp.]|nr:MAG: hypothetical protein C0625_02175 [Arcobacter sp.]